MHRNNPSLSYSTKIARALFLTVILLLTFAQFHLAKAGPNSPSTKTQNQKKLQEKIKLDYEALLPHYADIFGTQLDLILNKYWSKDGNWKADMMNDATAFAPRLLFKIYEKTNCEELYNRAIATCNYERDMINEVIQGKRKFDINSVFGI